MVIRIAKKPPEGGFFVDRNGTHGKYKSRLLLSGF